MFQTIMRRRCGMLDMTGYDEQDVRSCSSIGRFTGRSYHDLPVVEEVPDIQRIYHGPDAVGCQCDPLLTIPVRLK